MSTRNIQFHDKIRKNHCFLELLEEFCRDWKKEFESSKVFEPSAFEQLRLYCISIWAHHGIFENGVLLMYTLEGVSSVANFINAYEESQ